MYFMYLAISFRVERAGDGAGGGDGTRGEGDEGEGALVR
jgi:hypothetical protein